MFSGDFFNKYGHLSLNELHLIIPQKYEKCPFNE